MPMPWLFIRTVGKLCMVGALTTGGAGCAAVHDLSGAPRAGYQTNGSYVLSAQDQGLGCRELTERKASLQTQLNELPAKAMQQMQELPKTVVSAWARLTGSTDQGVPALAQYNEAKAEAAAVNASLEQKGCEAGYYGIETAGIHPHNAE